MRNIYEILREKELQMKTLEKEIEALRVVARILQEEEDKGVGAGAPKLTSEPAWKISAPAATETSRTYAPSPQPAAAVITPEAEIKTQTYSATQQNAPSTEAKPSRPWP
jgi:hypothetical protein